MTARAGSAGQFCGCVLLYLFAVASCGLPIRNQQIAGRYRLETTDVDEDTCLMWDWSDGSGPCVVAPTVFAIGFDDKYIVAKSHPENSRQNTAYWYIVRDVKSENRPEGVFRAKVKGPFSGKQYASLNAQLRLPEFTTVLSGLQ